MTFLSHSSLVQKGQILLSNTCFLRCVVFEFAKCSLISIKGGESASDTVILNAINAFSSKDNNGHDNNIPERDCVNLTPDDGHKGLIAAADRSFLHDVCERRGRSKSECSKGVHQQVDPK